MVYFDLVWEENFDAELCYTINEVDFEGPLKNTKSDLIGLIAHKESMLQGNFVVLSATTGDQTAGGGGEYYKVTL